MSCFKYLNTSILVAGIMSACILGLLASLLIEAFSLIELSQLHIYRHLYRYANHIAHLQPPVALNVKLSYMNIYMHAISITK